MFPKILTLNEMKLLRERCYTPEDLIAWSEQAIKWMEGAQDHIDMAFHPELGWAISPEFYNNSVQYYENFIKTYFGNQKRVAANDLNRNYDNDQISN